jgi:hypothetical protein
MRAKLQSLEKPDHKPCINPAKVYLLQRKCSNDQCNEKRKQLTLRRGSFDQAENASVPPFVHEVLQLPGKPLDSATRAFMEPRFGHDFSRVRVHTDEKAMQSAKSVNALAYTIGHHVVFGMSNYSPSSIQGRKLLAHELTHVIQQPALSVLPQRVLLSKYSDANTDRYELEANQIANNLTDYSNVRVHLRHTIPVLQRQSIPTGIGLKEAKPFGHADLKDDSLKQKWRTYIGSTTLMQVTPSGDYKEHCTKEYLTEIANTCPSRFSELRKEEFCTESKCLEFGRWGTSGDPETGKVVTDGLDTFIDRHRTRHPESLLEGTGKDKCSVVCHQRYKFDRKNDLGSFFVIRNFRADKYTPSGSKTALHITTGEIQKVPASLEAPSKEKFAKDIAPGLKSKGVLTEVPSVPKENSEKK